MVACSQWLDTSNCLWCDCHISQERNRISFPYASCRRADYSRYSSINFKRKLRFLKPWKIWMHWPLISWNAGEWWKKDIFEIFDQFRASGADPNVSDAYTINGQPGDLYPCSKSGTMPLYNCLDFLFYFCLIFL
jgi:hypothetical protein